MSDLIKKYGEIQRAKVDNILNLIKTLGDMVTASQALGLPKKVFGFDFHDGHVGLGGLASSVITCYQTFPNAQRKWLVNYWLDLLKFKKLTQYLLV